MLMVDTQTRTLNFHVYKPEIRPLDSVHSWRVLVSMTLGPGHYFISDKLSGLGVLG